MTFEMQPYIVYIKVDDKNRIQDVNSSENLIDTDGWIEIDRGYDARYAHAQGNFFPKHIHDERGVCRYLYTPDGESIWRERTQAEMDADWEEPVPVPDPINRIAELEAKLAAYETAYLEGVNEA